jgi:hypothetical protein
MGLVKRVAAVVVPVGLVVGGVAYGVAQHTSGDEGTLGLCTTKVGRLTVELSDVQARNASLISAIAVRRGMPAHAATIALATALQESKLYNLRGGDRDSLGIFQQRPSQGWGTPAQVRDPVHAANAFYDALARVDRYDTLPVTVAAQRVQRSGYPSAYAVYESDARALASALTGYSPAAFSCHLDAAGEGSTPPAARRAAALQHALGPAFGTVPVTVAPGAAIRVTAASRAQGWSLASYLVAHAERLHVSQVSFAGRTWTVGSTDGWTRDAGSDPQSVLLH